MKVKVEYMAQLRAKAECAAEEYTLDEGSSVLDLMRAVAGKHGSEVEVLLFDENGEPTQTVLCFVGSEQVEFDYALSDDDAVTLMTPISGG